jgi:hypothetical protein
MGELNVEKKSSLKQNLSSFAYLPPLSASALLW